MSNERLPITAIISLGLSQIIGYGTLYYSFSILAPAMAQDFSVSNEWIFAALSMALLAGGLLAPWIGKLIDRFGAAQVMTAGSAFAALGLAVCAAAPSSFAFIATLTIIEIAANLVQYGAAFALLVQLNPQVAQRSIVYLTLIAGFASTIFWPVTTMLQQWLTWQQIYLVFAALHLTICLPIHYMLARTIRTNHLNQDISPTQISVVIGNLPQQLRRYGLLLLLIAFSMQSLISAAVLVHMVPLLSVLGWGSSAAFIGAIFGPSQVASRLINMITGKNLPPINLAIISAALLTLAIVALMFGAPYIPAAIIFACLFGFGNGLFSIISGTLPLSLFGSNGYGTMQGKLMSARLILSALAPFAMALGLNKANIYLTLGTIITLGLTTIVLLLKLQKLQRTPIHAS